MGLAYRIGVKTPLTKNDLTILSNQKAGELSASELIRMTT